RVPMGGWPPRVRRLTRPDKEDENHATGTSQTIRTGAKTVALEDRGACGRPAVGDALGPGRASLPSAGPRPPGRGPLRGIRARAPRQEVPGPLHGPARHVLRAPAGLLRTELLRGDEGEGRPPSVHALSQRLPAGDEQAVTAGRDAVQPDGI